MFLPPACAPPLSRFESHSPSSLRRQDTADSSTEHEPKHELEDTRPERAPALPCLTMSEARAPRIHNAMPRRRRKRRKTTSYLASCLSLCAITSITLPTTYAQTTCIPLTGSTACPAFTNSSISTNPYLTGLFPFLSSVTDVTSFDSGLRTYASQGYVQDHYIRLFGCSGISLSNTTDVYARYTISFICNAIIQNSITVCGLSSADSQPLCANSCADFALSEQTIVSTPAICGSDPSSYAIQQLRADFTNCALPANSITTNCIPGYDNEPTNCGYQDNLEGLCTYCNSSTVNSTDSCCLESDVTSRCQDVRLPAFTSMQPLFTTTVSGVPTTVTASSSGTNAPDTGRSTARHGLSGGQIAGIVVGSVLGALLLLALLLFACLALRKRRNENDEKAAFAARRSPSPPSQRPAPVTRSAAQGRPPAGGRVVGMAALEGNSGSSPLTGTTPSTNHHSSPESFTYPGATAAAGIAAIPTRRERSPQRRQPSPQRSYDGQSPTPNLMGAAAEDNSPGSAQSEQMESFKDYYSSEEIFPGDLVSVLWAYSPRAEDEFELERGQMLRIVGIWDDGWATAVRVDQTAEEWDAQNDGRPPPSQRDSVVGGMAESGEVRAFPLVCATVPHHYRKAIEGESSASEEPRTSEELREQQQQAGTEEEDNEPRNRRSGMAFGTHPAYRPELP